ncbi:MAG TPA: caspase family protein [Pyrinomonadaceae bacterium]|nr:caspase family protein [Pyrinomonadaceae bacterium]
MTHPNSNSSKLYALLIGIDRYMPNQLPDGGHYPDLGGCVRDISHIERMLRTLGLKDDSIVKLLAPVTGETPSDAQRPTYENMVKAFTEITEKANPGDQLYIHYSGHGGRTPTLFPKLKGDNGLDESLVPTNIGDPGTRYLRDVEMLHLLRTMSDKGLVVTMVLDSCHSGGATRGMGGAAVRGIPSVDTTKRPTDSRVATNDELSRTWLGITAGNTRSVNTLSGWMPDLKGVVLLAACRANELANEFAFEGNERNGALTYWLLDALKQNGPGFTYRMLYNQIRPKIHAKFVSQTAQLEGEGNRQVFGSEHVQSQFAVNVLKIDQAKNRILLNTGKTQGVSKGTQFAVYPATADFSETDQRLAIVELDEPKETETWANIVQSLREEVIQVGAQAVLLGVGIRMRGRVRLVRQDNLPASVDQDSPLQRLNDEITKEDGTANKNKWVRLADEGEEADFQVAVNEHGEYEIWDADGKTLPNLRPALSGDSPGNSAKVVQRLVHLTKYRNVKLIANTDPNSKLARKLVVELGTLKPSENGDEGPGTFGEPFGLRSRPLSVGELACLRVKNLSNEPVNLTVLDLQPDWGISQIYPPPPETGEAKDNDLLEPGEEKALLIPIRADLPAGYQQGVDTIKAIASVESTSFQWLKLPALDQPDGTRSFKRGPANPLEQLMESFTAGEMTRQVVNLNAPKAKSWGTAEVEVRVRRPTIAHVHDPSLSLLQSAFDQVIAQKDGETRSRSVGGREEDFKRPELSHPIINEVTQYCIAVGNADISLEDLPSPDQVGLSEEQRRLLQDAQERGVVDVVKYCASMAVGMAKNLWAAKWKGDTTLFDQYQAALTKKFGDCDPNYKDAVIQYVKFLANRGEIPYVKWKQQSDFVIDDKAKLPEDAVIGVVADWGTGEPEALEVLWQLKSHNPNVVMHLGDIYYAGTEYEIENYFYQPWKRILQLDTSNVLSLVLPGNHDLYAGGQPFFGLLKKLGQEASFFCLRNDHWQLIGLDTALNDKLGGQPTALDPSEAEWVIDKIQNAGNRRNILLSHHQLFSANDQFNGKSYNENLYNQLHSILPKVDLWLWGHEHDLVIFDEHRGLRRGRCIGGSAFPVGNFEMPTTHVNPEIPFNKEVELSKGPAFYQHCYVVIKLAGPAATVLYYEDRDGGKLVYQEAV